MVGNPSILPDAILRGPVVLDGGLGTRLEARGNDVSGTLWSAEILRHNPDEVRAAHRDFFHAGARVATTASYQVSYDGFAREGIADQDVDRLLGQSVAVAQSARADCNLSAEETLVFASVGPYGASQSDGSEYTGDYGLSRDQLRDWHTRRVQVLANTSADALLCETIPSLDETGALVEVLATVDVPAILSFTVADGTLRSGESLETAVSIAAQLPGIVAVGVNCSAAIETDRALRLIREASSLPLIAYPNSGEVWDARSRSWAGSARSVASFVAGWAELGVAFIGGCCRVDTVELAQIARAVNEARR